MKPIQGMITTPGDITFQPAYAEAYNNLGVAYGSRGMFDQAEEDFEHAIRLKPDYFEACETMRQLLSSVFSLTT